MRWEYGLYALGFCITIGAATSTFAAGWHAVWAMLVGLAIFAVGIVVEERRYGGRSG